MSRRAASSTIDLILRRRGPKSSSPSQIGDYLYSKSRNFSLQGNSSSSFSPKLRALDLSDAYQLFDEMVRMHPHPYIVEYKKLLSIAAKTKHYSFAIYMFDELRLRGTPIVFTFNIAMHCYCLQQRVGYGLGLMSILLKSGYQPNVVTFNILIKGLFSGDRAADAVNMFENLLDLGICKPNDRMIAVMIDGLCKAGEIYAAIDLIRIVEDTGDLINIHACNALLDGFCKQRMIKDAEGVLQYMRG